MSDINYRKLMRSLNEEHNKFVLDTVHHIKTVDEPIYRFLPGGAGTGKTYVLKPLRETLERYFRSHTDHDFRNRCTITVAPTGKAGFLAGGNTIHSVLHVPANQSLTYRRLDHDTLNSVRSRLQNVKVWFIDEISMVGSKLFAFMDQRLQEVRNNAKPVGGSSMICLGDFFQLQPGYGQIYFWAKHIECSGDDYADLAPNLWQDHFKMFELSKIIHRQDCIASAQLINRLREVNQTSEDLETLNAQVMRKQFPLWHSAAKTVHRC